MKQSIIFILIFSVLSCAIDKKDSFSVLKKNTNEITGYNLVVEDYNYYYWAVLYNKKSFSPICSCFIGTTKQPLTASEMPAPFNGNLPIPESDASNKAVLKPLSNTDLSFKWDKKGESVVVYVKNHPFCLLDGAGQKGYTKSVKKNGSYGSPWDERIFRQIF